MYQIESIVFKLSVVKQQTINADKVYTYSVNPIQSLYTAVVCLAIVTFFTSAHAFLAECKQISKEDNKMLIKWGWMSFLQQNELCVCL